jgi:hypothetical protein
MLQIRGDQVEALRDARMLERIHKSMYTNIDSFRECSLEDTAEFSAIAFSHAKSLGFKSEQALASYVLSSWYVDIGFENKSSLLTALLEDLSSEFRIVFAMNAWVSSFLGTGDNITLANEEAKIAWIESAKFA